MDSLDHTFHGKPWVKNILSFHQRYFIIHWSSLLIDPELSLLLVHHGLIALQLTQFIKEFDECWLGPLVLFFASLDQLRVLLKLMKFVALDRYRGIAPVADIALIMDRPDAFLPHDLLYRSILWISELILLVFCEVLHNTPRVPIQSPLLADGCGHLKGG